MAATLWGLRTAGITFALVVAAIAAICLGAVLVEEAREARASSDR